MAMTSRDVMFVIRSTDYASRDVRRLAENFGRVGREMRAINKEMGQVTQKMRGDLAGATRKHADDMGKVNKQYQQIENTLQRRVAPVQQGLQRELQKSTEAFNRQNAALQRQSQLFSRDSQSRTAAALTREHTQAVNRLNEAYDRRVARHNWAGRAQEAENRHTAQANQLNREYDRTKARINDTTQRLARTNENERIALSNRRAEINRMLNTEKNLSETRQLQMRQERSLINERLTNIRNENSSRKQYANQELERAKQLRDSRLAAAKQERDNAVNTLQTAQRTSQQKHQARLQAIQATQRAELDAHRQTYERERVRVQQAQAVLKQIHTNEQQGLRAAAEARVQQHQQRAADARSRVQMTQRTLDQQFKLEKAHVQALAENRQRELQARQQQMQQYAAQVQRMLAAGAGMTLTGAVMLGAGTSVVNKLKSMTDAAVEFQREITRAYVQADPSEVITSIEELSGVALRVMREVPAAADTIPQTLFYIFTSMNVQVEEAEKLLRGFAMEAVAGNSSVEDAARSTIAIINGMGLATEDLERIQDFQFQTVRKGVITYEQLASNIGKLIPALRRSGQEIETGGAMLAFLTRNGLSAEMATTAAARALELLFDPRVVRRMEDMGVKVRDLNTGAFLPLVDILEQLSDEMGSMPSFERAERMLELFGGAGYRIQARRFFDVVIPNFAQFKEHIDWQIANAGSFARAVDIMFQDPATRIQLFKNQWEALRIEMGGAFVPILLQVMELGQRLVTWLTDLDPAAREATLRFIGLAAAGMAVVGALLTAAGLFVTVAGMVSMLTSSIGAAIAITAGLPIVLTAVVGALIAFAFYGDKVGELLGRLRSYLGTAEGAALGAAVALGTLTVAVALANTTMGTWVRVGILNLMAGLRNIGNIIPAIRTALLSLNAVNPVLLALTALTVGATAVFMIFRRRAQEAKKAVEDHTQALAALGDSFADGSTAIDDYGKKINDTIRETARLALVENDLHRAIDSNSRLRMGDVLAGISNENGAREQTRDAIQREVDALGDNLNALERTRAFRVANRTEAQKQYFAMLDLLEAYDAQSIASDQAQKDMLDELRTRGDLHAMVADYIEVSQGSNVESKRAAGYARERLEAALDLAVATGDLTEQEKLMLLGMADLEDGAEGLIAGLNEASAAARNLSTTMGNLTDAGNAWSAALQKINEGREEPLDTLKGLENAAKAWSDQLTVSANTTDAMFTDMATIMHEKGDLMAGDASLVMGAILAMGDAGPDAMAVLASADETEFLNILENIRRQAIWTSEVVIDSIDDMMVGWDNVLDKHGEPIIQHMGTISEGVATTVYRYSDLTQDHVGEMMEAYSDIIAAGKEPTQAEMDAIGVALAISARDGGDATVKAIAEELGVGIGVVQNILAQYGSSVGNGLNPILEALGKPRISYTQIQSGMASGSNLGWYRRNSGGLIPGGGPDRDSVLTYLTPGEFVLRRQAVENLDLHGLHEMNRTGNVGALVTRYNTGGFVTAGDVPRPPANYRPPQWPIDQPAHGMADKLYNAATSFMNTYAPPLSSGIGWQSMWRAVSARFPGVRLHSAFRPGAITATGNPSYHGMGRAVDISPRMDIFNWLAQHYRNSREIIFSPANSRQIHNGRNHMYSGITRSNHFDHIHWAMANGGMGRVTEPTWFLAGENGPEDFAFQPVSKKVGDGPGIDSYYGDFSTTGTAANVRNDAQIVAGIWGVTNWMDRFVPKYETVMRQATAENIAAVRTIESALGAMQTHLAAQHAIGPLKQQVEDYRNEIVKLASDAEKAELALENAWKAAREITDAERIGIIDAERRVRNAQYEFDSMTRGVHELNNELSVLRQQGRIDEMREAFNTMVGGEVDNSHITEQTAIIQQAQADYTAAQFELARIQAVLPTMDNEVQRLLLQFKAENALADSHKTLLEEQKKLADMQGGTAASARELRIAEIELALAEEQLIKLMQERNYESQDLEYAQLQLTEAQRNLTQTERDAVGPTDAVREAQQALAEIRQRQIDVTHDLRDAQYNLSMGELQLTQATIGLISAGQDLTALGPEQIRYFRELAAVAGMSAGAIDNVVRVTRELSGASADVNKAITQHSGVDRQRIEEGYSAVYARVRDIFNNRGVPIATPYETEVQRLTRIAHEVYSGQRTLDSVRASVDRIASDPTRTYDSGGILPPGLTMAVNKTGKNEYVFTQDQLKGMARGATVTIEEGAFQVNIEGNVSEQTLPVVEAAIGEAFEKMMMELRSNN